MRELLYFATHCVGCGRPLRRISKGRWVIKKRSSNGRSSRTSPADVTTAALESTARSDALADRSDAGRA
ncbi:MAG: hypothetical protein B7Y74_09260 [Novosphingobium sp. 35-62-5]|nr:MAG: hypothetical protein B7Y74_09260 [Novosphingobium sp. 35-62-5]